MYVTIFRFRQWAYEINGKLFKKVMNWHRMDGRILQWGGIELALPTGLYMSINIFIALGPPVILV